eukprot:Colp12_sorted_trinity150504_noHs@14315
MAYLTQDTLSPVEFYALDEPADHDELLRGDKENIEAIQGLFVTLNKSARSNYTPLLLATRTGNIAAVLDLIEQGCDLNEPINGDLFEDFGTGCSDNPALGIASWFGHLEIVTLLLENGASVQPTDATDGRSRHKTSLHLASAMGHTEIVLKLLEAGADVNCLTQEGPPLMSAAVNAERDIMEIFLQNGADPDLTDKEGNTALHIMAELGDVIGIRLLSEYKATLDAVNKAGLTPLTYAIESLNTSAGYKTVGWSEIDEVVQTLMELGSDPNLLTTRRRTYPGSTGRLYYTASILHYLVDSKCDPVS